MTRADASDGDPHLAEALARLLPAELLSGLSGECRDFAADVARREAPAEPAPGERRLTATGWPVAADFEQQQLDAAARWGLAAIPSEERLGPWARVHQLALLLLAPTGAARLCVSHSDALARVLLAHDPALAAQALPRLASRDPRGAGWGALWFEEAEPVVEPGDDRSVAQREPDGRFRISGRRVQALALARDVATLARPEGASPGRRGLSLFLFEAGAGLRLETPPQGAFPLVRVTLDGVVAERVGDLGGGAEKLATGRRVLALHQTAWACSLTGRLVERLSAVAAAGRRGPTPLRRATLASLQLEQEAGLALGFECARLLGRIEAGSASEADALLFSLLAPVARLYAVRQTAAVAADVAEELGARGGLAESGLPGLLEDLRRLVAVGEAGGSVCLDFLHEARRDERLEQVLESLRGRVHRVGQGPLAELAEPLALRLGGFAAGYRRTLAAGEAPAEAAARNLAGAFAALAVGVPLAEQAAWSLAHGRAGHSAAAARRWITTRIPRLPDPAHADADAVLGEAAGAEPEPRASDRRSPSNG